VNDKPIDLKALGKTFGDFARTQGVDPSAVDRMEESFSKPLPEGVFLVAAGNRETDDTPFVKGDESRFVHIQHHYDANGLTGEMTVIERVPSGPLSFSNPHRYRGYRIYPSDYVPMKGTEFSFTHEDYDGAEDANDNRGGHAGSIEDAKAQIDELEDE
jgi:hypothetical protein